MNNAGGISRPGGSTTAIYLGMREQLEGGLEHAVLEFDYHQFRLSKYFDATQVFSVSFGDIKNIQTDGVQVVVSYTNPSAGTIGRYIPYNMSELEQFCELLNTILDNIQELVHGQSTVIKDHCLKYKPKICFRKCVIHQKSFKRKGKASSISKFVKNKKKSVSIPLTRKPVGFLVLTEGHLLCFEDEKALIPCVMYPVREVAVKESSSDNHTMTLSCSGDKAIFQADTEGDDRSLFISALECAKSASDSEVEEIRAIVDEIQALFEDTFDKELPEHVTLLRRLWDASNLGVSDDSQDAEGIPFELQTNRWKDLGFQRNDPVSDLRATGLLGLQNLVYFAEEHPTIFLHMARDQQQSSEMEYPFATASINITYLMIQLLGLRKPRPWFPTMDTHPLLFFNRRAWEELYTIIFRLFDQKWNQMLVGYMGFQKVIDRTREDVAVQLHTRNPMGEEPFIFEMLGILLNDLENFKSDTHRKAEMATHSFPSRDALHPQGAGAPPSSESSSPPVAAAESEASPAPLSSHSSLEPLSMASSDDAGEEETHSLAAKEKPPAPDALNRVSFAALPTPTWKASTPATRNAARGALLGTKSHETSPESEAPSCPRVSALTMHLTTDQSFEEEENSD